VLLLFADYADILWMETAYPVYSEAKKFADAVLGAKPHMWLSYNLSPSFNWDKANMTDDEIRDYIFKLGELGFVWQFITLAGFHVNGLSIHTFAKRYKKEGMLAYVRDVQRVERENGIELLTHQKWSGVDIVNRVLNIVSQGKSSTTTVSGSSNTENQF